MGDHVLGTKFCHLLTRQVGPIVGDDGVRKPEATHNIFLEGLDNLLPCDVRKWHYFHPLSEVVYDHQHESELRQCSGKRTYHVKPPMDEGLGTMQSMKVHDRFV